MADLVPSGINRTTGQTQQLTSSDTLTDISGGSTGGGASPTGAVVTFAGSSAPSGWLFCAGQAVSRATYSALFAVISVTYGVGDGSTTFNLPDAKGKSPVGANNSGLPGGVDGGFTTRNLADTGGEETHTLSEAEMPSHTHAFNGLSSSGLPGASNGTVGKEATTGADGAVTTAAKGGGTAHNVMQPFLVFNVIIKT